MNSEGGHSPSDGGELMDKKSNIMAQKSEAERTKELIGILTAISFVSKRLAKNLLLLEQKSSEMGGLKEDAGKQCVSAHAD